MSRYNNSIIYKVCHKDPNIQDFYVGSTCNFAKRKHAHKASCENPNVQGYNSFVYQFIRDHDGWNAFDMIMIEKYPCQNKREKEARERYWIEQLKPSLNKAIPTRSHKEYCQDNHEVLSKKHMQYKKDNKEKIKEIEKRYVEKNEDKIKEKKKEYREKTKEHIKEHKGKKEMCICGAEYTHDHKSRHEQSKKHKEFLESQK